MNVMARGGRVMLLVSDDQTFHFETNVDDALGGRIDIPTIVMKNQDGRTLIDYMKKNILSKVTMSIKFVSLNDNGKVELKLFMRSDDVKSLHFFKEFRSYYNKLCKPY
jgi:hypothetical protein